MAVIGDQIVGPAPAEPPGIDQRQVSVSGAAADVTRNGLYTSRR